ncbi:L-lactate permease [Moraxella atlantae]|uniref:L-lactate permease n=1 Tax=Faucicola atlantae TaxID=34059 RepID=UPI003751F385
MQQWQQLYDPFGNIWLSSAVALIPIVFFFIALAVLRLKGNIAGTITVILALLVALFAYHMPPAMALAAGAYGFMYGLWPIAWIIIGTLFLYKITVKTGQFDIIRASILSLTEDQRLQMLLVGFAFGTFLEGAAGFGAPVAITAALLVGLGFRPLYAAGLCLIVNTAPVAFGAMGIPIIVAGQVSNIDTHAISQMVGRQLPFFVPIVLIWIMAIMDGWRGVKETFPAIVVGGGAFALAQFLTANYMGPELPDITAAIAALISLTLLFKVWQPKHIFRFDEAEQAELSTQPAVKHTTGEIIKAWMPFAILTAMVSIWSIKPFKDLFAKGKDGMPDGALADMVVSVKVPFLHNMVQKMPPIVPDVADYAAIYKFDWFSAVGTAIMLAALICIVFLKMRPKEALNTFGETLYELRIPIYSIGMVLAFAFIANYSGLSATLALALAHTGKAFTFFSPMLGWLGVFLTGSDTSANALFSALQATTAQQINVPEVLLVAANTSGGVTGKMISPQSIAIACAAVGLVGKESDLFRFTVKHSLTFTVMMGVLITLQAYVFPWMIPALPAVAGH